MGDQEPNGHDRFKVKVIQNEDILSKQFISRAFYKRNSNTVVICHLVYQIGYTPKS